MNIKSFRESEKLYYQLIKYPQEIIPLMDHVLTEIFQDMFPDLDENFPGIKVRPFNLGTSINMRELNPNGLNHVL